MATKIQNRRDTAANWTTQNPVLGQGEIAIENDTDKIKIGDGTTSWNSLQYLDHIYDKEIHVDLTNGNNTNTGQRESPLLTVEAAWAQRMLDIGTRYVIYVHGTAQFPTTITIDGGGAAVSGMFTYLIGDTNSSGRWEVGPATLKVLNAGAVTFLGVGYYSRLELASNLADNYANFGTGWIYGDVAVIGTPTNTIQLNLYGARLDVHNITGNTSTLDTIMRDGATMEFMNGGSWHDISCFNGSVDIDQNDTVTITGAFFNFPGCGLNVESGGTINIATYYPYGGTLSRHPSGTINITTTVNRGRVDSEHIAFDTSGTGLTSTNVQDAIKEIEGSGGATTLDELTDVTLISAGNADVLKFNSTGSVWEDGRVDYQELGSTPINIVDTDRYSMTGSEAVTLFEISNSSTTGGGLRITMPNGTTQGAIVFKVDMGSNGSMALYADGSLFYTGAGYVWIDSSDVRMPNLPTTNPGGSGVVWNDGGTLKVT